MGSERQTQFSVRRASVILATLAALTISAPGLTTDTYHYDPQGRLTSITNENGSTIAYSYDEAGNRSGVTITNPSGLLSLSSTSYGGGEASGQRLVSVTVNRTGGSGGPASVNYATSNGTAVAGSDYTAASGTLNWTNFDAAPKSFTVTILDDATYEGSETFNVALSGASGATLAAPMSATISIADDEPAPPGSIQLSTTSFSVGEAGSSATITATRTGGSNGPVGVSYATSNGTATAGSDYTSTSGTLSWTNGDSANKTFAIPITNDSAVESSETVNITLSAPTGGATLGSPSTGTLTITDDDSTLALSTSSYSVAENGTSVTISATRTGATTNAATVNYATSNGTATAGSDYTTTGGILNWGVGDSANKTFTVPIIDDGTYEGNETFGVTLSGASGANLGSPASATVTITDNENPPPGSLQLTASSASVAENGGSVSLTVSRTGGSFGAASINYATSNGTATSGSDYTSTSGALNWANGDAANKTITIPIVNDSTYENSETFTLTLSGASGAAAGSPSSATITITNDGDVTPPVPTGLTALPAGTGKNYTVSWSAALNAASYVLTENSTQYTITAPTTSKSFTNKPSGDYTYQVKACASGGQCSANSTQIVRQVCNPGCFFAPPGGH